MPPKKSNLNNACSKDARRKRFERGQKSAEQIAAKHAAFSIPDHFEEDCLLRRAVNVKLVEGNLPTTLETYKTTCAYCSAVKMYNDHRSFHKFPLRNPTLLKKWLAAVGKKDYKPNERSRLCSDHFEQTCFRPSGYRVSQRLKNSAVPTIFMPLVPAEMLGETQNVARNSSPELSPTKYLWVDAEMAVQDSEDWEPRSLSNPMERVFPADVCDEIGTPVRATTLKQNRQAITLDTAELVHMDHNYDSTPSELRMKLLLSRTTIKRLQQQTRIQKQQIAQLKKKICTLNQLISR